VVNAISFGETGRVEISYNRNTLLFQRDVKVCIWNLLGGTSISV